MFENQEKVNKLQMSSHDFKWENFLKWMNFRLNLVTFITVVDVLKQMLGERKQNYDKVLQNIDLLVKKTINSLTFLYKNPENVGLAIVKQAMFNAHQNIRFCPFL